MKGGGEGEEVGGEEMEEGWRMGIMAQGRTEIETSKRVSRHSWMIFFPAV